MKKLSFFIMVFLFSVMNINAECTYKELRELNTLASHVEYTYDYNESTDSFDVTITNLTDKFYVLYETVQYTPSNGSLVISGVPFGTRMEIEVTVALGSDCVYEIPRIIYINIPYKNNYYGSNLCVGHERLKACNSKFLDYKLSENTFLSLIEKDKEEIKREEEEKPQEEVKEKEENIIDITVNVVKEYYIPVILVIVSSGITISIYSIIIRKIKHGL